MVPFKETDDHLEMNESKICFCSICGIHAPYNCGQCHKRPYCSKVHQSLDWTQGMHKETCQGSQVPQAIKQWLDCFLFPEILLEEEEEPEKNVSINDLTLQTHASLDLEELEDEDEDAELEGEQETTTDVDKAFLKFQKRISLAPDQILRYGRVNPDGHNEEPLWVSSDNQIESANVPACPACNAPRTFEFQVFLVFIYSRLCLKCLSI